MLVIRKLATWKRVGMCTKYFCCICGKRNKAINNILPYTQIFFRTILLELCIIQQSCFHVTPAINSCQNNRLHVFLDPRHRGDVSLNQNDGTLRRNGLLGNVHEGIGVDSTLRKRNRYWSVRWRDFLGASIRGQPCSSS